MRLKNIVKLVNEDLSDTPTSSLNTSDVPTNISLLIVQKNIIEDNKVSNIIDISDKVSETLSEMNKVIDNINIEDPSNCITPYEANLIDIVTEHLKRSIKYKCTKKFPSMENFGGKMSRSKAHRLAVEDLDSLCNEIKDIRKSTIIRRYTNLIETIKSITNSKVNLLNYVNSVTIDSNEFYNGDKYQPSSNGIDLIPKDYVRNIFNLKESLDYKLPTVAILNGLNDFKNNLSTSVLIPKINLLKSYLESFNNSDLDKDSFDKFHEKLNELTYTIIDTLPFTRTFSSYEDKHNKFTESSIRNKKSILYPLSDIELCLYVYKNYSPISIDVSIGELNENSKVSALSNQESSTILSTSLSILNTFEYTNLITECIELMISIEKKQEDKKVTNDCCTVLSDSVIEKFINIIYLFNTLAYIELKIINGLTDYCKDSIITLGSKVIDTGIK